MRRSSSSSSVLGCLLSDKGVACICEMLADNGTIQAAKLGLNGISYIGARGISRMLRSNRSLTSLRLNDNAIGLQGAVTIASALAANETLTELDLKNNAIGADGATAIAQRFRGHFLWSRAIVDSTRAKDTSSD